MHTRHLATEISTLNICAFIVDMKSNAVPSNSNGVISSASDESSVATAGGMVIFLYM